MKSPRNTKIFIGRLPTPCAIKRNSLNVKRSKVKVTSRLMLNPDKTDCILFGTRQRATDITTVKVADTTAVLKDKIKILGVILDSHLTMDSQVSDICRSAFYHIRAIRHIWRTITDDVAKTIAAVLSLPLVSTTSTLHCMEYQRKTFIACSECRTL